MKYIPSIAFEEMSGSAKGVTAAKMKKYISRETPEDIMDPIVQPGLL
ncbi:MAG: hypothetical protein PUC61_04735 [Bacteroidales bacterium]|nr:hypothetical protein [Bacteroidales bacterium]